ncbi:MAG: hypothetical protein AB7I18_11840 [Candidatus Berkiella sp.]
MIKKSVFENDLIAGMHKELVKQASEKNTDNLGDAVDYLNSAIDIFQEAGLDTKADAVLKVLSKIANKKTHVRTMPSFEKLFEHGLTREDIMNINKGDTRALARLNLSMRKAGYTDDEIRGFLGDKYLPLETADRWAKEDPMGKFRNWMTDVLNPGPKPGEEISIAPVSSPEMPKSKPQGEEISFQSLLADDNDARRKPKNPTKVPDGHTKGLTSEKMVNNLKNHGTVFNMADDHNSEDLLNADIDLDIEGNPEHIENFEDERE